MKYKIGDKVRVKSIEWYNENKNEFGKILMNTHIFTSDMAKHCGNIVTIDYIGIDSYHIKEGDSLNGWTEDMFEGIVNYKENIEITLNDKNYIIDVKKAMELGIVKETYTRCKSWEEFKLKYKGTRGYYYDYATDKIYNPLDPWGASEQITQQDAIEIQSFSKLLKLRRDWIGTWEPDWSNCERKYCIEVCRNEFYVNCNTLYSKTFSFPTEEMAKEFFDLFKDLFEQCKNLI